MPSGQQQTAMVVIGSGQAWYVVSRDAGGSTIVLAQFDTQKAAQAYLLPPL